MKSARCRFAPARGRGWLPLLACCVLAASTLPSRAQSDAPGTPSPAATSPSGMVTTADFPAASGGEGAAGGDIIQTGCSTCGSGLLGDPTPPAALGPGIPCAQGCGCAQCYPGQIPCDCCTDKPDFVHRFLSGFYRCVCCPDPCYMSTWRPLANAAFFAEEVKPITQIRLGGLFAGEYQFPDKAEFLFAQENVKGPRYNGPALLPGVKPPGSPNVDFSQGYLFFEGAINRFGLFVNLPYMNVEPTLYPGASGFGDMSIGTKSLLLDCELIQFTYQFTTFIPTGNFLNGLGTGHVSLEPALLAAIKMTQNTYLQIETAYWFPIGGTRTFQGPVFHYHFSLNQELLRCGCEKPIDIIGTMELGGYEIAGGAFTSPVTGLPVSAKDVGNIVQAGPGLRLVICNKIDFGCGSQFALTTDRMAAAMANLQFRWRF